MLNELLLATWHEQHENIAFILEGKKSPDSVNALYNTALIKFDYLNYDDTYELARKCIKALSAINNLYNMRKAIILNKEYYSSIGTIATIKFLDDKPALVGDLFIFEGSLYKITGVIVSGSSKQIKSNFLDGIYDCRIVQIENIDSV